MKKENNSCELCGEEHVCDCNNEKPIKVKFCPQCKSTDVKFVFELQNLFGLVPRIRCNKCLNQSNDFPILITSKKELNNKRKKNG